MDLKKRNPDGVNVRVAEKIKALGGAFDGSDLSENLIDLQAFRLRRRFRMSAALAILVAELAYANGRVA